MCNILSDPHRFISIHIPVSLFSLLLLPLGCFFVSLYYTLEQSLCYHFSTSKPSPTSLFFIFRLPVSLAPHPRQKLETFSHLMHQKILIGRFLFNHSLIFHSQFQNRMGSFYIFCEFVVGVVQLLSLVRVFCSTMDCSLPGFSVHGISQATVGCHFLLQRIYARVCLQANLIIKSIVV